MSGNKENTTKHSRFSRYRYTPATAVVDLVREREVGPTKMGLDPIAMDTKD